MPLQNFIGLVLPLGVAIAIGAIVIGLFYREQSDYQHQQNYDFTGSDFRPDEGYDTGASKSRKKDEEERCVICYDSMKRFQCIRTLPCMHNFHKKCISEWLRFDNICPTCRTVVP